jgi:hypothetical protein
MSTPPSPSGTVTANIPDAVGTYSSPEHRHDDSYPYRIRFVDDREHDSPHCESHDHPLENLDENHGGAPQPTHGAPTNVCGHPYSL